MSTDADTQGPPPAGQAAPAGQAMGQFHVRSVPMYFSLGEFVLFTRQLKVWRTMGQLQEPCETPPPASQFWADLPAGLDGLFWNDLPISSKLRRLALQGPAIRYVPTQYVHYYTEIDGEFQDYLKRFGGKSRNTLRRMCRRIADANGGQLDFRVYSAPGEAMEFHRLARAVSVKTYQERLLKVGLPDTEKFRSQMLQTAAEGRMRGYLLCVKSQPITYLYCYAVGDVLVAGPVGHDPAFSPLSPGTSLFYLIIERLFQTREFRVLDFSQGQSWYKDRFSTAAVRCADIFYLRRTVRNFALVGLHATLDAVSAGVGRVLAMAGVKDRIRKLLRRGGEAEKPASPQGEGGADGPDRDGGAEGAHAGSGRPCPPN